MKQTLFYIAKMDCPTEEQLIRNRLKSVDGIDGLDFNLMQNIALSIGIKAVFLVLAFLDVATLWMAVFAVMGASLLVVFNGLRILRQGGRAA